MFRSAIKFFPYTLHGNGRNSVSQMELMFVQIEKKNQIDLFIFKE